MRKFKKIIILLIFVFATTISMGAKSIDTVAKKVYRVYLDGKSLGLINSKKDLENYINNEQEALKKKYNVKKIYVPDNLHIQEEITYNEKIYTTKEIYEMIKDKSYFTLKGYKITIKNTEDNKKNNAIVIYVLDKKIFTEAVDKTVRSFISQEDYDVYSKNKKQEIGETGKIVENITIENEIKITKQNIPANKKIYLDTNELTKFLLFGNNNSETEYTVKSGDTISTVADSNKMSTEELLLMNPKIKNEKALLYEGEVVKTGILNPQFKVAQVDEQVSLEEKKYTTETKYDSSQPTSYYQVERQGVNGVNRVTQKIKRVNGEITNIVPVKTEEVKPVTNEIVIKGNKQSPNYYNGGQYGNIVAVTGPWGWPASCSSVSSGYGYRWGGLHDGMDIAGCGYGSNIFAAQDGTVVKSTRKNGGYAGGYGDNGEYIIIDHHNGYFTIYAHLCPGCRYVNEGDNVTKGQVIGGMGHTGAATGTHLHFGLWAGFPYYGGSSRNPMSLY